MASTIHLLKQYDGLDAAGPWEMPWKELCFFGTSRSTAAEAAPQGNSGDSGLWLFHRILFFLSVFQHTTVQLLRHFPTVI